MIQKNRKSRIKDETLKAFILSALFLSLFFFNLNFISAEEFGYTYLEPGENLNQVTYLNYTEVNVNNSNFWAGYTPTTYYTYIKGLLDTAYDLVYCKLTGCTMTGNLITSGNITADTYFGDWNGGNVDGNISVGEQFNSAYDPFNKFYSFNLHTSNATGYDAYEQVGTLAEVTASPLTWGGTQEADFSPLWASDDSRHSPQNSATRTKYPAILMKFLTGESPADALYINVTGEANVNAYTYGYYIWDYDSTAWELLGSAHSTPYNLDTTYSAVINTNAENYIDTDGTVYIMIRAITLGGTLQ